MNSDVSQDTINASLSGLCQNVLHFFAPQLGIPHTFLMVSYQYKFQDEDQTKVKGSVKYVCLLICSPETYCLLISWFTRQAVCRNLAMQTNYILIIG